MALLIHSSGPGEQIAYCFHGQEWLLKVAGDKVLADKIDSQDGHPVEINMERPGWYLRGGRLPICPEHRADGDVPLATKEE